MQQLDLEIVGGGDWTKDRIVKDCAELFIFNKNLTIRSPKATRPWQHVLEPLFGYINLAEKLYKSKIYWCMELWSQY